MKAFVVGYTGGIGKEIVEHALKHHMFTSLALIGRRKTALHASNDKVAVEEHIVNFDELPQEPFTGCDVGFCCLGTTQAKAGGRENYIKIDHDYAVSVARQAKAAGCKSFTIVTAWGANKSSRMFYPRLKGEIEEDVKQVGFEKVLILRPGYLSGRTNESRPIEKLYNCVFKPLGYVTDSMTCTVGQAARAAVMGIIGEGATAVQVYENKDIIRQAKAYDDKYGGAAPAARAGGQ